MDLLAQFDCFRAGEDEQIRRRAALAMELTAEERLAEAFALCRTAAALLDALPADVQERARAYREPIGPDAEELLRRYLIGP